MAMAVNNQRDFLQVCSEEVGPYFQIAKEELGKLAQKVSSYSMDLFSRIPQLHQEKLSSLCSHLAARVKPLIDNYHQHRVQTMICAVATALLLISVPEFTLIFGALGALQNKPVRGEDGHVKIFSDGKVASVALGALSLLIAPSFLSAFAILVGSYQLGKIVNNCYHSIIR
jgi:hypothetical protein